VAEGLAQWLTSENAIMFAAADAQAAADAMQTATIERGRAVVRLVEICGGNQTRAARALGLDQSTVNKLIRRVSMSAHPAA
jgi:DNA-binding protein Fis